MQNYYHPKKMVFSAAGQVDHDEFVNMIIKSTPNLPQGKADNRVKASYKGGEYRKEKKLEQIHILENLHPKINSAKSKVIVLNAINNRLKNERFKKLLYNW
mgnify:CR=1 FL=1